MAMLREKERSQLFCLLQPERKQSYILLLFCLFGWFGVVIWLYLPAFNEAERRPSILSVSIKCFTKLLKCLVGKILVKCPF